MKKLCIAAAVLLAFGVVTGCSKKNDAKDGRIQVVATIFPEYDWVREIVGEHTDRVQVSLLLDNGVDLHSFQPGVRDIAKISSSDIFIYVGGESDEWVEDVLESAGNAGMKAISLLNVLGDRVKEEEVVEGMEAGHEHEGHHHDGDHDGIAGHDDHDDDHEGVAGHDDHEGDHHHEEAELDEHVWLSLRLAKFLSAEICSALCEKDTENASSYQKNLASYQAKLDALDAEYVAAVKNGSKKTLLFGDRFPFRYLVDDYGLSYYAAFSGCSAESEAGFNTILFLSNKMDELALSSVCQIEGSSGKIARTVIDNTAEKMAAVLTFDSLQSVSSKQIKEGITYLGVMENNLQVLRAALK